MPTQLATALQAIVAEYQADIDLVQNGGNEEEEQEEQMSLPTMLMFPSTRLIETMTDAIKVHFLPLSSQPVQKSSFHISTSWHFQSFLYDVNFWHQQTGSKLFKISGETSQIRIK